MQNNILNLPGYRRCEYLLMLSPHEDLWNRIMKLKETFAEKYSCPMAFGTKPYVALVKFGQYEMMEEKITNRLKMVAMAMPAFKVELKDFGSFPSHTIYINVTTKVPVVNLVKAVKQAQHLMKTNKDNKPYFIDEPHLTVARKLAPWQYENAWLEYSNASFTGRFIANDMLLLRRREGEKGYQKVQRFEFMNLPVVTKQGNLFG